MASHPAGTQTGQLDSRQTQVTIGPQLETWSLTWASFTLILLTLAVLFRHEPWIGATWLFVGAPFLIYRLVGIFPHRTRADSVTLGRAVVILAFALWTYLTPMQTWPKTVMATSILMADALDGWVARRYGPTFWGGVFDMETDGLIGSVLALLAFTFTDASLFVLGIAAWRPAYVLALPILKRRGFVISSNRTGSWRGKTVCIFSLSVLVAHFAPVPLPLSFLAFAGFLALSFSFGVDLAAMKKSGVTS